MTKTIWILAIAAAFVAGTISTTTVLADHFNPCDIPGAVEETEGKWANIWHAICSLKMADDADMDKDSSNEAQDLSGTGEVVLSTTAAGDGGGTVTCEDITGDASLCDGNDAVDDADNDSTNELQTLSVGSDITLSQGGGSVSCEDITGDASLCDGDDAVGTPQQLVSRIVSQELVPFDQLPDSCIVQNIFSVACTLSCEPNEVMVAAQDSFGTVVPNGNSVVFVLGQCSPEDPICPGGFDNTFAKAKCVSLASP